MSRQPSRQLDSPRKLTTRPATPITTINSGHCRSDLAAALASGRGTSHQMFGTFDHVAEQHGPRHRPDPARHRRHPRSDLAYARSRSPIRPSSVRVMPTSTHTAPGLIISAVTSLGRPRCRDHDVGLEGMPGQLDRPGVTQRDGRVLALPR